MEKLNILFKATLAIYWKSLKLSLMLFKRNLILMLFVGIFFPLLTLFGIAHGQFIKIFFPGFEYMFEWIPTPIFSFIALVLWSVYFTWIRVIIRDSKLEWSDLKRFDLDILYGLVFLFFILFIIGKADQYITKGFLSLFFPIIFNTCYEAIYINGYFGEDIFKKSWEFLKENWWEWYLPLLVFALILFAPSLSLEYFSILLLQIPAQLLPNSIFGPVMSYFDAGYNILLTIFIYLFSCFFLIFRAFLYSELDKSTRRKRVYQWV